MTFSYCPVSIPITKPLRFYTMFCGFFAAEMFPRQGAENFFCLSGSPNGKKPEISEKTRRSCSCLQHQPCRARRRAAHRDAKSRRAKRRAGRNGARSRFRSWQRGGAAAHRVAKRAEFCNNANSFGAAAVGATLTHLNDGWMNNGRQKFFRNARCRGRGNARQGGTPF